MSMKAYRSLVRMRILLLLQYRMAALAGITTQFMWVSQDYGAAGLWAAGEPQPLNLEQAVGYVWLGQAMLRMLPWDGDSDVQELIRTGNVAYELCRSVDLYNMVCPGLSTADSSTILRAVPVFAISLFVLLSSFALKMPSVSGLAACWWLVGALLLGVL